LERIHLSPPHLGKKEFDFVKKAFATNYIAPIGPMVDAFEIEFAEYIGVKHCAAVASGTAAIHLGLRALGIGIGHEVFTSILTFIGSVSPVIFLGATPVFIDCDSESWNMNPVLLEQELKKSYKNGNLPKAVVPTELYGQCCNLSKIVEICDQYGVLVICDSAESLGGRYLAVKPKNITSNEECIKENACYRSVCPIEPISTAETPTKANIDLWRHAGKGARASIYSFNGNKIITTSGGGIIASDDKELIEYTRFLSQQAREPFPHYEHEEIGYNYRMSNIIAAIGRGQLLVLEERVARKREIFNYYFNALGDLPGIEFMPEAPYSRCTRWLTVVLITPEEFGVDKEAVRVALSEENIESRPVWKPMHLQPVFICDEEKGDRKGYRAISIEKKRYYCRVVGGGVAEDLFKRGLCLPSGTAMSEKDLDRVIRVIRRIHRG
jgi:dTDP-4-amino-4,6-dideoxygalactose transaminase